MSDLTFYTNPMSRGRIARWMLEELGRPYETVVVSYGEEMKGPEYRALNPMGKVPTVRHGDVVITECAAICTYLAEAFPAAGLTPPPGSPERGTFLRWMFFAAGPVEAAITDTAFGWQPQGAKQEGRAGYGSMAQVTDTLEALVSDREWILGDVFSAADVYLGSQISWGQMFDTMEKRPALTDYVGRITSRPAAVRARELDDALMAEQETG